jgi:hypothetical protein
MSLSSMRRRHHPDTTRTSHRALTAPLRSSQHRQQVRAVQRKLLLGVGNMLAVGHSAYLMPVSAVADWLTVRNRSDRLLDSKIGH